MRRRRTSAARPHDFSRAHARPPPAAQREPVPGEVVGRDSSRGQPSPKFDAGRAGCKVAAATDSDGWVASRLRAARACHLGTSVRACALGWRRSPRELSGCSERRTIDLPSSGVPSRTPGLCTSSSGRLRAAALVTLLRGPPRDQRDLRLPSNQRTIPLSVTPDSVRTPDQSGPVRTPDSGLGSVAMPATSAPLFAT